MRPWTVYKAFGGILTVCSLPGAIGILCGPDLSLGRQAPPSPATAILPGLLGVAGLYIFIASDKALKAAERSAPLRHPLVDWKGMAIAAALMGLYLLAIILKARHVI